MDNLKLLFSEQLVCPTSPHKSFQMRSLPTDKVPITLMIIKGTHYDKGYYYGLHFSKAIKYVIEKTTYFITKIGLGKDHIKASKEEIYKTSPQIFRNVPLHFIEEMRGVINGCKDAGDPLEDDRDVIIYMTFFEMNEQACCSMYGIQPSDSKASTFHLNNSEYPYTTGYDRYPVCIMYYPQNAKGERDGFSFFSIGYPALMGVLTGINEKGLALSQIRATFMKGAFSNEGIPYPYLIHEALRTCENTNQAYEYFLDKPKTNPKFYTASDPERRSDSVQLWFTAPDFMYKYLPGEMPDTSLITEKEFAFYEPLPNSVYWLDMFAPGCVLGSENAYRSILIRLGKIEIKEAIEIAKELGSRYLILSVVYDLTHLKVWFSYSYCKIPAHEREYLMLDLKEFM